MKIVMGVMVVLLFLLCLGCASQQKMRQEDDKTVLGIVYDPNYGAGKLPDGF